MCPGPEGIYHSGLIVLLSMPALKPAPSVPVPMEKRPEYERLISMSLLKPYLSASTRRPAPLRKPNRLKGALTLKSIVEGAPGNPTHCWRVRADAVIIPMQCEYYALEGLSQLINSINLVKKHINPSLSVFGVILTMYDPRLNLTQQVETEVRTYFGDKVFETVIPRNVRLSEAPSYGVPVCLYDGRSKGAEAYMALTREIIKRGDVR